MKEYFIAHPYLGAATVIFGLPAALAGLASIVRAARGAPEPIVSLTESLREKRDAPPHKPA